MDKENPSLIVLMADDDEDDCLLVESAFKEMDLAYELRFVGDGRELLDYLYNEGDFSDLEKYPRPNLILLDLNMPRIDGREALAIIKSDPQLNNIPILILTTSGEERDIALAKRAGASAFLSKPEAFADLTDMLSKFCIAILHNPNIPFQVIGC
ncbi:Response regulator receiver protein [Syntrophobacter sp. SbD2]|nr:Response regulator receiver protein [Syntrophobacter sp. SbD2]